MLEFIVAVTLGKNPKKILQTQNTINKKESRAVDSMLSLRQKSISHGVTYHKQKTTTYLNWLSKIDEIKEVSEKKE